MREIQVYVQMFDFKLCHRVNSFCASWEFVLKVLWHALVIIP